MKTEIKIITPKMALQCLNLNIDNRPIRPSLVKTYAEDMKEGRWKLTHQGIAFDEDNQLLDGQQRLSAIVLADIPVKMLVTSGIPRSNNEGIDIGLRRTFGDTAWFMGRLNHGLNHGKWYGSTTRGMHESAFGGKTEALSIPHLLEFAKRHEGAICFALECFEGNGRFPTHVKCKATLGAVARAFYSQDHQRLKMFAQVLSTGMPESEEDVAAVKIRTYLMQGTADYHQLRARKAARALKAFCDREIIAKIYDPGDAVFAIPE